MNRLADIAPRLARAWDAHRAECWQNAQMRAPKLRRPGETHEEATRRVYLTMMEYRAERS